jgi:hypothetical protein
LSGIRPDGRSGPASSSSEYEQALAAHDRDRAEMVAKLDGLRAARPKKKKKKKKAEPEPE